MSILYIVIPLCGQIWAVYGSYTLVILIEIKFALTVLFLSLNGVFLSEDIEKVCFLD